MQDKRQPKKKYIINYIFFLVLVAIIILLLLSNCTKKKEEYEKTNGKVDIFEINCEKKECKVEPSSNKAEPPKEETKKIVPTNKEEKKENKIDIDTKQPEETKEEEPVPTPETIPEEDEEGEVIAKDNNITWSNNSVLNIFTNSTNSNNGIIAPEDSNTYEFKIKNNTIYNVKYSITFEEINNSSINIKYKLKRGNSYIAGDENNWVNYNELLINNKTLNTKKSDTYYLEWKWVSGENDTLIGNQLNAQYQLKMKMEAEEIN